MFDLSDRILGGASFVNPSALLGIGAKKFFTSNTFKSLVAKSFGGKTVHPPTVQIARIKDKAQRLEKEQSKQVRKQSKETKKIKSAQEKQALLADELSKQGIKLGDEFRLLESVPLTRQEQTLIRESVNKVEAEDMAKFIMQERVKGNAVGEGFTVKDIKNTPLNESRKGRFTGTRGAIGSDVNQSLSKPATAQTKLIEEAKKFDTAEEFVKSKGDPLFHGSKNAKDIKNFSLDKGGSTESSIDRSGGIFFSNQKEIAEQFSGKLKTSDSSGKGREGVIEARVLDDSSFINIGEDTEVTKDLIDITKSLGHGGIIWNRGSGVKINNKTTPLKTGQTPEIETIVFDTDNIKTKDQLKDIFKEAKSSQ